VLVPELQVRRKLEFQLLLAEAMWHCESSHPLEDPRDLLGRGFFGDWFGRAVRIAGSTFANIRHR